MARISEATFGNKLAKGQQLLDFIRTLPRYEPPSDYLKVENFGKLLEKVNEANKQVASTNDLLAQARATRTNLYYGDNGAKIRCAMIRDFVGILPTGKTSSAYIIIQKESQKMNNYKKPTKKQETEGEAETPAKRAISSAETSFGSVLQSLKNVLEVVKNLPTYTPTNDLITLDSVQKYIDSIEQANQAVNAQLYPYNDSVVKRQELYEGTEGLRVAFQGIKTFIAANYGKTSMEFKEVSKIKY
jgi:hypothetical protein